MIKKTEWKDAGKNIKHQKPQTNFISLLYRGGFILALLLPNFAAAGFEEGWAAYQHQDYAAALREWQLLAEQGDAIAQNNLGVMYDKGQGVAQDDQATAKWFRLAAEHGNVSAQYFLGNMYRSGQGVPKDEQEADKWHRLAKQGDEKRKNLLGVESEINR
ncbi:tetratricopeptide repeat protein [Stenoxybacter acetivorans]|uniref:tetratricopeptide repeat protein n=1 Tax=Stenoxybacter acetivorans TaxID=422441 RepID=UPI00068A6AB7|nr:tetratricopeptide repeat protein [Stenoxybacter acetivorans]